MKQLTTFFILIFLLLPGTSVIGMELPVIDPIVSTDKALKFGLWTVYNDGSDILIVDRDGSRLIAVDANTIVRDADKGFQLFDRGTSAQSSGFNENTVQAALAAEVKGQMQNARYLFLNNIYLVDGDTLTIFNVNDEDDSGIAVPRTVINKFSNGVQHIGTDTVSIIDPTLTIPPPVTPPTPGDGFIARLDVDGDGTNDALTDGLLVIRYLFGLRGEALVSGAIGANATRTTAADIEDFLKAP